MNAGVQESSVVIQLPKLTRDYIFRRMKGIKGYLDPVDALMISTILAAQNDARFGGSVAEIGVYFGRSFHLMAGLLRPDECAFAADLFNIGNTTWVQYVDQNAEINNSPGVANQDFLKPGGITIRDAYTRPFYARLGVRFEF